MTSGLYQYLQECSGKITVDGELLGTGFCVAPGQVLTCAHVVEEYIKTPQKLKIYLQRERIDVLSIARYLPKPYPDIALLQIVRTDHPCVYLDRTYEPHNAVYTFGHTQAYPDGDPGLGVIEGEREVEDRVYIKFKETEVVGGFSGSALLNDATGYVCGMTQSTRFEDWGGNAIPVEVIFKELPELRQRNLDYHRKNSRWQELRSIHVKAILEQAATLKTAFTPHAVLCKTSDHIKKKWKAKFLVGRAEELRLVSQYLDQGLSVAIAGFVGIGKTSLAAEVAVQRIQAGHGAVLWLEGRDATAEMLIEALADELGDHLKSPAANIDELRIHLCNLLASNQIDLVVIDNTSDPGAIDALNSAIPGGTRLLVTSEEKIVCLDELIILKDLTTDEAKELLAYSAKNPDLLRDPGAAHLVRLLDHHPYAVFIAGKRLSIGEKELTPEGLYQRLKSAPHRIYLKELGKPGVEALIEDHLKTVDERSLPALLAFGALTYPTVSTELMVTCLGRSREEVQERLDDLYLQSLLEQPASGAYKPQELLFSYLKARAAESLPPLPPLAESLLPYLSQYKDSYDLIQVDIDNLLAAMGEADTQTLVQAVCWLVIGGYPIPQVSPYFNTRGHSLALLARLDQGIAAARLLGHGLQPTLHYLLGKRGDAHTDRGEYSRAVEAFRESLALVESLEAGSQQERWIKISTLTGKAYALWGKREEASVYIYPAYRQACRSQDADLVSFVLEVQSETAGENKQYQRAYRLAANLVHLNAARVQALPDDDEAKYAYFVSLMNLGSAQLDLALQSEGSVEPAIANHLKAREIAFQLDNDLPQAQVNTALGEDYHYLGLRERAQEYLHQAVPLLFRLGEIRAAEKYKRFLSEHGYPPAPEPEGMEEGG